MEQRHAGLSADSAKHVVAAAMALDRGLVDVAERSLRRLPRNAAEHPEVLRLRAGALGMRGQHSAAVALLQSALAQRQGDPLIFNALGLSLREMGAVDDSVAAFAHACKVAPDFPQAWSNFGAMFYTLGRFDEARRAVDQALRIAPDYRAARLLLGHLKRAEGDVAGAAEDYRAVVTRHPELGTAWLALAELRPPAVTAAEMDHMRAALKRDSVSQSERVALEFALGTALESFGRHAEAFAAFSAANTRLRERVPWNSAQFSERVSGILRQFDAAGTPEEQQLGGEVIFLVSLPRAGSTLTEQILAAHPQIQGAGELPDLSAVLAEESQRREQAFPSWVARMTPQDWTRLGRRYLERTAQWRRVRPRFTDKQPSNWLMLGAALRMLPGARVIECQRDPVETGWSCFKHMFTQHALGFCCDLGDIGAYWHDYARAQAHWNTLFPMRIYKQVYEDLIDDSEGATRKLLDFCGVPFDAACLRFHQAERRVATASASQVREPLQRNTARAAHYGALLDPLRAALGAAGTAGAAGASA